MTDQPTRRFRLAADTPSEALFEYLVTEDPDKALRLIESGEVRPGVLTYAAEIAGRELPADVVVPVLLRLLKHPAPVVREGAVYGLREHDEPRVLGALQALQKDKSPAVRSAAAGAIALMEGRHMEKL